MKRAATRFARLVVTVGLFAAIVGCTSTTHEWQEEVQLSDGVVLDVKRSIRFKKVGVPIGSDRTGWISDGEDLSFVEPASARVIKWSAHRRTAALIDRFDGQYVIVAAQSRCEFEDKGQPLWMVYVLTSTGWAAGPMTKLSNKRSPNLALDSQDFRSTKSWSRLTVSHKSELDAGSRVANGLKTIDLHDPLKCL